MLTTAEALLELDRMESADVELLGVDGFRIEPDGRYEAPIDLILDFTASEAQPTTAAQRFQQARRFVTSNDAPQIRWEIAVGSPQQ